MSTVITQEEKSVRLIMLLANNEDSNKPVSYDYIISAYWLDELDLEVGMDMIVDYVFKFLNQEERKLVSRITIIHTNDPIVHNITRNMGVSGGIANIENCQFGNVIVPSAIIFESIFE